MNHIVLNKIKQKLEDTALNRDEIKQLVQSLSDLDDSKSFGFGLVVGRIYNAFHYQSKRILNREPTDTEFEEFLEFIQNKKSDIQNLW